jgi:hypothetical protein
VYLNHALGDKNMFKVNTNALPVLTTVVVVVVVAVQQLT